MAQGLRSGRAQTRGPVDQNARLQNIVIGRILYETAR